MDDESHALPAREGYADATRWVLVPYDGSPTARALLTSAAILAREHAAGILLTIGGTDVGALTVHLEQAGALLDLPIPLIGYVLAPGDLHGALERVVASRSVIALAVPLGGSPLTPWYERAVRFILRGTLGPTVAFYTDVQPGPGRAGRFGAWSLPRWRLPFGRNQALSPE